MKSGTAALAAALFFCGTGSAFAANSQISDDFQSMTQWLSHEMANGLAFNAGSTFDPPREVTGWALQPDLSLGIGRIPFNKSNFPALKVQALNDQGGAGIFPDSVLFPNLALHLRMGLPWRGDAYIRLADATTPPGYKISPTMTAQVQTNSLGFGARQHFDLWEEDLPKVVLGAHFNHVRGRTRLKGKTNVDIDAFFRSDSELNGEIDWNLNSYALTAVAYKSYEAWTPFAGFGYNYASGSVRSKLELKANTFLIADAVGEGSERPEKSQGRWIAGVQYARPRWSAFFNAEVKALGRLQYRSWIAQAGIALPYEIGRGYKIIYKKRVPGVVDDASRVREPRREIEEKPVRKAAPEPKRRPLAPKPPEQSQPDLIFLQ